MSTAAIRTATLTPRRQSAIGKTLADTGYLTGRKIHALVRQPWVLMFSIAQPAIWLFLFGELFKKIIDIPGFGAHGSYLNYLIPGIVAMSEIGRAHV